MFPFNVPIVKACLWMCDDHAHGMQVKLCKANTRGVTYPTAKEGQKKAGYNTGIGTVEGKEWCIRQGIWEFIEPHKEDASEAKWIAHHYVRSKKGCLPFGIKNPEDTCMSYM